MKGEAEVHPARSRSEFPQFQSALPDLTVKLGHRRVGHVWRQVGGHAVHRNVVLMQVVEDRMQVGERLAQKRSALPAPRIIPFKITLPQHLDGKSKAQWSRAMLIGH